MRDRVALCLPVRRERLDRSPEVEEHHMLQFAFFLQKFFAERVRNDDTGATAVEYGLIVTLIAVVIIGAVTGIGLALQGQFNNVLSHL